MEYVVKIDKYDNQSPQDIIHLDTGENILPWREWKPGHEWSDQLGDFEDIVQSVFVETSWCDEIISQVAIMDYLSTNMRFIGPFYILMVFGVHLTAILSQWFRTRRPCWPKCFDGEARKAVEEVDVRFTPPKHAAWATPRFTTWGGWFCNRSI